MKFSEQWLREFVNPDITTDELVEQLTMAGLEVEGVTSCSPAFSNVKVARVIKIKPHPDADKLQICSIETESGNVLDVVCGANNVQTGNCYPYAAVGAELAKGKKIKESQVKGVLSKGMLCSAAELGLSDDTEGLLTLGEEAIPGQMLADLLKLDDNIIEISLTPNRGDCLSLAGLAREVAVLNQQKFIPENTNPAAETIDEFRNIKLEANESCPRYVGRVIKGVDISKPSPTWLTERLRRSEIRSINIVVDITNYVMLESGQPMHAFDHGKLEGDIKVRYATDKEKVILLDSEEYELTSDTLVIADNSGGIAMAGIMGGLKTAVTTETCDIFLESACFSPTSIMGKARQYGLHTDASHRFERGVDYALQRQAIERASELILELCGGNPGPITDVFIEEHLPEPVSVLLRQSRVNQLLGTDIRPEQSRDILERLGCKVSVEDETFHVEIPSHRFDLSLEVDLIEEIARIYGYGNIKSRIAQAEISFVPEGNPSRLLVDEFKTILINRAYNEVITYSFVEPEIQKQLLGNEQELALLNPISSDMSVMRRSLWPGLLETLQKNINRQQSRLRLFEVGYVYHGYAEEQQKLNLAGIIYGKKYKNQWNNDNTHSNFYDLKGDIEALLSILNQEQEIIFQTGQHHALHPGQTAQIFLADQLIGYLGAVHPLHLQALDIKQSAYLFELDITKIPQKTAVKFATLSKYPSIKRDLAIIIDKATLAEEVLFHIKKGGEKYLCNLELFDLYLGEGIDIEKKSLALGLTFQGSSSTLTDEEVDAAVQRILASLHKRFGATLRE